MVNLNQLRVFGAVARLSSFTRAAAELHLTQPGVSKHIKQLEEHYGLPLFERIGRTIRLTQAGEILFEGTMQLAAALSSAEKQIQNIGKSIQGKLTIGASFTAGIYVLPDILARLQKQHPKVDVILDIAVSQSIERKVLNNSLDIGIVGHPIMDRRLVVQDFLTDELVLIVPRNHPWAHKTRIPIRDLRHERFIVGATGSGVRCIVDECLRQKNVVLDKIIDLGNTEGIKKGVEAGFGVAILSRRAVQREIDAGTLHELCVAGLNTKRMLRYIYRRGRYLSRSETAFLKLLTDLRPSGRSSSSGKMASH